DALVEGVGLWIVGSGLPDRAAAVLPAVFAILPRFIAGFTGARDRIGAPRHLAGVEVGCLDVTADTEFTTGGAHDGKVAHDQRRDGQRLTDGRFGDLALPHHFAGLLVDGEHAPVERDGDDFVLP